MENSTNPPDHDSAITIQHHEQLIVYLSNINISNFVTVKLSGGRNYHLWNKQMLCVIKTHDMCSLLDDHPTSSSGSSSSIKNKLNNIYVDRLLQGWIFGSVSEDVLGIIVHLDSAKDVWEKLKSCFGSTMITTSKQGETTTNDDKGTSSSETATKTEETTQLESKDSYLITKEETDKSFREQDEDADWVELYGDLSQKNELTKEIRSNGDTLLHKVIAIHVPVLAGLILRQINEQELPRMKNKNGDTVLHIAASVGNTFAVKQLVEKNKDLLHIEDNEGNTPLDKAIKYMHLDIIASLLKAAEKETDVDKSITFLPSLETGVEIVVNAISTKRYDLARKLINSNPIYAVSNDRILMAVATTFPPELNYVETFIRPSRDISAILDKMVVATTKELFQLLVVMFAVMSHEMKRVVTCRINFYLVLIYGAWAIVIGLPFGSLSMMIQLILILLLMVSVPFRVLYLLLWKTAATVGVPSIIKKIEQKHKDIEQAKEILRLVCKKIRDKCQGDRSSSADLYTQPILEAARQDSSEVAVEILRTWPEAIRCKDNYDYDIFQLATIHRSERIYNLIYSYVGDHRCIYRTIEDSCNNNMVHLAGRLAPSNKLKRRTGAALQLQRELQWRQEVEKLVFPACITKENIFEETPEMVFTKEHKDLVKEGEKWIKTVAESCSITAALVTTIVFAAAITVPGGSKQDTGIPVFKKEIAFTVFAIADVISLFSSVTSLLVFLSVLTARYAEQDFLVSLPRRLVIGLFTLFLSTTAMMVAFSATSFLVFSPHRPWMLAPICGCAFLPIAFFLFLQFPLMLDLMWSTYIFKFGQSETKIYKLNPNIMLFFLGK